ncbi:MAG: pLS20_p028 family conjugation system transmembrane protein [Lachnospiraceae bacterium]
MDPNDILNVLYRNRDIFTNNNIISTAGRALGWLVVELLGWILEASKTLYNRAFGLVDITAWTGMNDFISEIKPLVVLFISLSFIALGFMFILGKHRKFNFLYSILIFGVVATSSTFLFSTINGWAISFKDAVVGETDISDSAKLIQDNLYDLLYIDQEIGLKYMTKDDRPRYETFTINDIDKIDINEVISKDTEGLSEDSKEIVQYDIQFFPSNNERGLIEMDDGLLWTDYFNQFYYRYQFDYGMFFMTSISLILVYLMLSYKCARVIYELFTSRVLVTFHSGDMTGTKKVTKILMHIRDAYYALCFTAVSIRLYLMFVNYLDLTTTGVTKGILMLFVAICVIDGANIIQKITGVDAGLSGLFGKLYAGSQVVRGGMAAGKTMGGLVEKVSRKPRELLGEKMGAGIAQLLGGGKGSSKAGESFTKMDQNISKSQGKQTGGKEQADPKGKGSLGSADMEAQINKNKEAAKTGSTNTHDIDAEGSARPQSGADETGTNDAFSQMEEETTSKAAFEGDNQGKERDNYSGQRDSMPESFSSMEASIEGRGSQGRDVYQGSGKTASTTQPVGSARVTQGQQGKAKEQQSPDMFRRYDRNRRSVPDRGVAGGYSSGISRPAETKRQTDTDKKAELYKLNGKPIKRTDLTEKKSYAEGEKQRQPASADREILLNGRPLRKEDQ